MFIAADPGLIWIVIGPVICFILLLFVGGAVFVILKKKYDPSVCMFYRLSCF